jgi:hypothetical protein
MPVSTRRTKRKSPSPLSRNNNTKKTKRNSPSNKSTKASSMNKSTKAASPSPKKTGYVPFVPKTRPPKIETDYDKSSPYLIQNRLDLLYDNLKGKNVGLMSGCFCPPHAGHYNSFKTAIKDLDLDILYLTTINSGEANWGRHKTAGSHTIYVLIMYAKKLEEETGCSVLIENCASCPPIGLHKNRGDYKYYDRVSFMNWIPVDVKNVFNIQFVENEEQRAKTIKLDDRHFGNKDMYKELRLKAPEKYIHIKFEREEDGLSATKFSKCLAAIKSGELSRNACDKYISHLNEEEKEDYLREVLRYDIH